MTGGKNDPTKPSSPPRSPIEEHTHNLSRRTGSGTNSGQTYRLTPGGDGGNSRDATASAGAHAHGFSAEFSLTGRSAAAGGGEAHNNVQPTLVLNYIVKT